VSYQSNIRGGAQIFARSINEGRLDERLADGGRGAEFAFLAEGGCVRGRGQARISECFGRGVEVLSSVVGVGLVSIA
jgi:hypothetical protein